MPFTHARKVVDRSLFTSLLFDEIALFLGENSNWTFGPIEPSLAWRAHWLLPQGASLHNIFPAAVKSGFSAVSQKAGSRMD